MAQGIRRFSPFNPLNGWVENEHRCRKSQIPCKIPCLQGIDTETGANGTPAPAKQSGQTADSPNLSRKARIGRLFRRAGKSPGGKIGPITRPIPKNLRLTPQKLPFAGDCAETWFDLRWMAGPEWASRQSSNAMGRFWGFPPRTARRMSATGFLGVATPSESGVHLLYYFRQENNLQKGISEGADRGICRGARLTTASVRFAPC